MDKVFAELMEFHMAACRSKLLQCLHCPLSKQFMQMPVLAGDGYTYEFESLLEYAEEKQNANERITSPKTGRPMRYVKLRPNQVIRRLTGFKQEWLVSIDNQNSDLNILCRKIKEEVHA